jgi:hypothetical protein
MEFMLKIRGLRNFTIRNLSVYKIRPLKTTRQMTMAKPFAFSSKHGLGTALWDTNRYSYHDLTGVPTACSCGGFCRTIK